MKQITVKSIDAFLSKKNFKESNTEVKVNDKGCKLLLHGNEIAKVVNGKLFITNAGWNTATTKERLNGLPNVNISQKNWGWYLNGKKWNGDWIEVK